MGSPDGPAGGNPAGHGPGVHGSADIRSPAGPGVHGPAVTWSPAVPLLRLGPPTLDQAFDADDLPALRSAVAAHGSDLGLGGPRLRDLVLVAHELACNAVRHGHATRAAPGRLRLWRAGSIVICQVSDDGPGLADPAEAGRELAPPSAHNGRGLWIIRQVADSLDIFSGPDGATVTATMALSPAPAFT